MKLRSFISINKRRIKAEFQQISQSWLGIFVGIKAIMVEKYVNLRTGKHIFITL